MYLSNRGYSKYRFFLALKEETEDIQPLVHIQTAAGVSQHHYHLLLSSRSNIKTFQSSIDTVEEVSERVYNKGYITFQFLPTSGYSVISEIIWSYCCLLIFTEKFEFEEA